MAKTNKAVEQTPATETNGTVETPVVNLDGSVSVPTEPVVVPAPAEELTSEKLEKLRQDEAAAWDKLENLMASGQKGSKEMKDTNILILNIEGQIAKEIADLKKAKALEEIAAQRNARAQLLKDVIDSYDNMLRVESAHQAGTATMEESNTANADYRKAYDVVVNELQARYATSKPSTPASGGDAKVSTTSNGEKGKAIIARYLELKAEGKTDADAKKVIEGEGYSRGTTGAVILAYQRSIGEKN